MSNKKGTDAAHYITASVHCSDFSKNIIEMQGGQV